MMTSDERRQRAARDGHGAAACRPGTGAARRAPTAGAHAIALAACIGLAAPGLAAAGPLFASDVLEDGLLTVDTATGAGAFVGTFGGGHGGIGGLAFDPNSATLYGIDSTLSTLVTIDPATGAATAAPSTTGVTTSSDSGLAFDPNSNTLFWANATIGASGTPQLFTLDTATGLPTLVGDFTSGVAIVGLAYDRNTDTLFGVSGLDGVANDRLFTIDPLTAALTLVGSDLGFNGESSGLAFDPDTDTLFWGDELTDSLYTIDTTTGVAAPVGAFGVSGPNNNAGRFVRGLAFQASSTVPAPPSGVLLGLALAAACAARRRHRRPG